MRSWSRDVRAWVVLIGSILSGLCALACVVAPVVQTHARYEWTSTASSGVSLPLNPGRPASIHVDVGCAGAAAASGAGAIFTTRPAVPGNDDHALSMLRTAAGLTIRSGDRLLADVPRERLGTCRTLGVDVTAYRARVELDGVPTVTRTEDARPVITSLVSGSAATVSVSVVADTRFDSRPSVAKSVLGFIAVVAYAVAFFASWGMARRRRTTAGSSRRRSGRGALLLDAAVLATLGGWAAIGGGTDDDGFISQILSTSTTSGYIGNYARWMNTPEAPFGWFYEVYARWWDLHSAIAWMRLPPLLLGIAGWLMVSRVAVPRLIRDPGREARVAAAATFTATWMVFGNSVRPEIWYALGLLGTALLVDRALVSGRWATGAAAFLTAGLTVGCGPTGLVAFGPLLVVLPTVLRRRRMMWRRPPRARLLLTAFVALCLSSAGLVTVLMFADQSLAAVWSGTELRNGLGPSYPWYEDLRRYRAVSRAGAARQFAVWVPAAVAVCTWATLTRLGRLPGVRLSLARLVVGAHLLFYPILALSPTKLYHHFGGLMLLSAVVAALLAHTLVTSGTRLHPASVSLGVALVGTATAISWLAPNTWWGLARAGLYSPAAPISMGPIRLATLVLGLTVLVAFAVVTAGHGRMGRRRVAWLHRRVATIFVLGAALVPLAHVVFFARAAADRPGRYTIAADTVASAAGRGCRLGQVITAEPDPLSGRLTAHGADTFARRDGFGLPVWRPPVGRSETGWFDIPDSRRTGDVPLVVATAGLTTADALVVEFAGGARRPVTGAGTALAGAGLRDHRIDLPAGSAPARFRIHARVSAGSALVVGVPRVPKVQPLAQVVGDAPVLVDWRIAFFTPCLHQPAEHDGLVDVPRFALGEAGFTQMSTQPKAGGPFVGVRDVVDVRSVPLYPVPADSDPAVARLQLVALDPRWAPGPQPVIGSTQVSGWARQPSLLASQG